jgi:hypothetical protein
MTRSAPWFPVTVLTALLVVGAIVPACADPGYLGIGARPENQTLSPTLKERYGVDFGALVDYVAPNSPAETADLRVGDLILAIERQPIADWQALSQAIQAAPPGAILTVGFLRADKPMERKVVLGARPAQDPQPDQQQEPAPRRRPAITLGSVLRALAQSRAAQDQQQQAIQEQEQERQAQEQQEQAERNQQRAQERYLQQQQFQHEEEMLRLNWQYRALSPPSFGGTTYTAPRSYMAPRYYTRSAPCPPLTLPRIWQGTKEIGGALVHGGAKIIDALIGK